MYKHHERIIRRLIAQAAAVLESAESSASIILEISAAKGALDHSSPLELREMLRAYEVEMEQMQALESPEEEMQSLERMISDLSAFAGSEEHE